MSLKSILLYGNRTWETSPNITNAVRETVKSKRFMDIRYLMIPISDNNPVYLVHETKGYMSSFDHARVEYDPVITHFSTEYDCYREEYPEGVMAVLPSQTIEISSLDQLLNCLHSLNRILYCNKLSHANQDETICYEIMEFTRFKLTIESDNSPIFIEMNLTTEKGKFGPREILQKIKKWYRPFELKNPIYFEGNHWGFISDQPQIGDSDVRSVFLPATKSVLLMNQSEKRILFEGIYSAYCYNIIFWKDQYKSNDIREVKANFDRAEHLPMSNTLRYNALWAHDVSDFLEYIAYLPFLYVTLLMMADPESETSHYDISTRIDIAIYDLGFLEVDSNVENQICIADVIRNICERFYSDVEE